MKFSFFSLILFGAIYFFLPNEHMVFFKNGVHWYECVCYTVLHKDIFWEIYVCIGRISRCTHFFLYKISEDDFNSLISSYFLPTSPSIQLHALFLILLNKQATSKARQIKQANKLKCKEKEKPQHSHRP